MPFEQRRPPSEGQQPDRDPWNRRVAGDLIGHLESTMRGAAARAAAFIQSHADTRDALTWEHKGPADFVSAVDRGAEDLLRADLLGAFPDATFIGEETYDPAAPLGSGLAFVVDPLDGTTNFLHGFPWYAVSIGALWEGELVAGVVHNAATGEQFHAVRGGGAHRDDQPIVVSRITEPARALVGSGFPFKDPHNLERYGRQFAAVTRTTAGIRRAGAAALDLCDVACGRFDAFWELSLSAWDLAGGLLIIQEAGGIVTTPDGGPATVSHTGLCAGNPAMHRWLLDTLRNA